VSILFSFSFSFWMHEYFIPSTPLPAQQPVTLRAGFKKCGYTSHLVRGVSGGVAADGEEV